MEWKATGVFRTRAWLVRQGFSIAFVELDVDGLPGMRGCEACSRRLGAIPVPVTMGLREMPEGSRLPVLTKPRPKTFIPGWISIRENTIAELVFCCKTRSHKSTAIQGSRMQLLEGVK